MLHIHMHFYHLFYPATLNRRFTNFRDINFLTRFSLFLFRTTNTLHHHRNIISKSKFQKIIFQNKNSTSSWKEKKLNYNISLLLEPYYPIHISKEKLPLYRITRTSPNPSNIQTILHIYLNVARPLNFPHISPHFSSESIITVEVIDNRKHLSTPWLRIRTLFLQRLSLKMEKFEGNTLQHFFFETRREGNRRVGKAAFGKAAR